MASTMSITRLRSSFQRSIPECPERPQNGPGALLPWKTKAINLGVWGRAPTIFIEGTGRRHEHYVHSVHHGHGHPLCHCAFRSQTPDNSQSTLLLVMLITRNVALAPYNNSRR